MAAGGRFCSAAAVAALLLAASTAAPAADANHSVPEAAVSESGVPDGLGPNDDWRIVERQAKARPSSAAAASASARAALSGESRPVVSACGERARPAGEPYRTIMANLNALWGTGARIYEPLAVAPPHARRGGCIFLSRPFLARLTRRWMGIDDPAQLAPMLYAIAAHELGHLAHGDLTAARANVSDEAKELEADRFAGYSLWRLDIRFDADDTARYYRLAGDDFVGARNDHGTSRQRADAFKDGWDLARMGLPESSAERPAGGLDPDESIVPSAQDDMR